MSKRSYASLHTHVVEKGTVRTGPTAMFTAGSCGERSSNFRRAYKLMYCRYYSVVSLSQIAIAHCVLV